MCISIEETAKTCQINKYYPIILDLEDTFSLNMIKDEIISRFDADESISNEYEKLLEWIDRRIKISQICFGRL